MGNVIRSRVKVTKLTNLTILTIAYQGLAIVNPRSTWLPNVPQTAIKTNITLRPSLSTTKPRNGEQGADSTYTMLQNKRK